MFLDCFGTLETCSCDGLKPYLLSSSLGGVSLILCVSEEGGRALCS